MLSFKQFLDKPIKSIEEISKEFKVSIPYLNKQLERGIQVELEHTSSKEIAKHIAFAHLSEKPNYYELLDKYIENPK